MPKSIYTPSEQLYHALRARTGPWQYHGQGMNEGYLRELYPFDFRARTYAEVLIDHAQAWLALRMQKPSSFMDTHVGLTREADSELFARVIDINETLHAAGIMMNPMLEHPIKWRITEELAYRYHLSGGVAGGMGVFLGTMYYLYPDAVVFADTPLEYQTMLGIAERIWDETAA